MIPNQPTFNRKAMSFWLLQLVGWTPLFPLFIALYGDDEWLSSNALLYASSVWLFGVLGSLLLRYFYRSNWMSNRHLLVWGLLLVAAFFVMSQAVALFHHSLWWGMSVIHDRFLGIFNQQSHVAIGVLMFPIYAFWSLMYFMLTGRERLDRAVIEQQQLNLALRDYQLDSLLRQLNPHFMFNAINNIRALIIIQPDKARDMLTSFADIMRYQINVDSEPMVSVEQELTFVNDYVELNLLQFQERLHYETHIEDTTLTRSIPRMSIQLLVENAIKHGFSKTTTPGQLVVCSQLNANNQLVIEVRNPGQLTTAKSDCGIGLDNLRKRLDMAYSGDYQLTLSEEKNGVNCRMVIGALEC